MKSHLILVISDLTRFIKFWLVSTLALSLCMCPRISRWFLLVLFLVPLSSPWRGQPGHIVRLVPYLPLLFALYTFPSLFSFLSLGFSLSLRTWLVSFVGFSLCFIPTFSLLGPAWAYCPARPSSLPSSYYLFHFLLYFSLLSALLPLFLSTGVCPKAASPNVATPYDPKWSLAAMSCAYLRWCAHVLPPLSHTPPMLMVPPTLLAACGYLTLWSLGTLLHNIFRALIQGFLSLLPFSPLEALLI